jgi:hypothetical protein
MAQTLKRSSLYARGKNAISAANMYSLGPMRSLPSHARLSGNASGDDDNAGTSEGLFQTVIGRKVSSHFSWSGNVRYIGRYARSVDDIKQPQLWRIGRISKYI